MLNTKYKNARVHCSPLRTQLQKLKYLNNAWDMEDNMRIRVWEVEKLGKANELEV